MTGCLRCADAAVCTTCDTDNNWVSDGVTGCVCSAAHYPNGLICSPCIVGCLQCDNGLNCNNCDAANHFKPDDNKLCVCESKSFYQDGNTCKYCASALSHCDICDGPTVCEECTSPFQVKDNVCKCVDGKYEDVNECTDCPEGCHLCNSKDECTECKEDYSLEDKVCKKSGIDTLVIVLIVVGVVVLAGAGNSQFILSIRDREVHQEEEIAPLPGRLRGTLICAIIGIRIIILYHLYLSIYH